MARKRTIGKTLRTIGKTIVDRSKASGGGGSKRDLVEDSAIRGLSKEEIRRLSIDAWEPSLLRHMLEAENKLRRR